MEAVTTKGKAAKVSYPNGVALQESATIAAAAGTK
jgi:hypothetical protein